MGNWKLIVAGFCIPINVFLIVVGILIRDVYTVLMALACIGLVLLPLIQERYEKEDEKKNDSE